MTQNSSQGAKKQARARTGRKHEFVWDGRGARGEDARYSIIPGRAASDRSLTCLHFRIIAHLGRFNEKKGWCRLNQSELAEMFGVRRQAINKAVKDLVTWRYIEKRDQTESGESFCLYKITIDAVECPKDKGGGVSAVADTPQGDRCPVKRTPVSAGGGHVRLETPLSAWSGHPLSNGITTRACIDHIDHIERGPELSLVDCKTRLRDGWAPTGQMVAWVRLHYRPTKKGSSLDDIIARSARRFFKIKGGTARTEQEWADEWELWWDGEDRVCQRTEPPAPQGIRRLTLITALEMFIAKGIRWDTNLGPAPANRAQAQVWLADLKKQEEEFVTEFRSSPPPHSTTEPRTTASCA